MARVLPRTAVGYARLLLRRVLLLIALLAAVFAAVEVLPGNTARAVLGRDATEAQVAAKEHELGLDRPLPVRFAEWIGGVATGDFGHTARGRSVNGLLAESFPPTLVLGGLAVALTVLASLALGAWWAAASGAMGPARGRGLVARILEPTTTTAAAIPEFVVATLLIMIFALGLGLLPAVTVSGASGFPVGTEMYILPVLALAVPHIGWNTRVVRAALADAARAPHVESAVLEGLRTRAVLVRHVLPFALPTIVASYATTVGMVLGGSVVVETIFNFRGLGALLAGSVADRDTSLVAAVVALTGIVIMVVLAVADAVRVRAARGVV